MQLAVVVLNFNRRDLTVACVESLFAAGDPPDAVFVVDNGSNPGEQPSEIEIAPARLLVNDWNAGFAGGNDTGLAAAIAAGFDAVMVLNNDCVVAPSSMGALKQELREHPGHAISPRIVEPSGALWFGGGNVDVRSGYVLHNDRRTGADLVPFVSGCALAMPSDLWLRVGGFDRSLFLYWEDADLSLRLAEAGIPIIVCSDAVIEHRVGGTSDTGDGAAQGTSFYFKARNRLWLARRRRLSRLGVALAMPRWIFREIRRSPTRPAVLGLARGLVAGAFRRVPPPDIALAANGT